MMSHLDDIPKETLKFCNNLAGLTVLDVGCGDMLADFGLLVRGSQHITGLDIWKHHESSIVEQTASRIRDAGLPVPKDYASKLSYTSYDGVNFPFGNDQFDLIFSWSAFEHIPDVPQVLSEIRRVVKPQGRVFLQVYPWFPSFWGSHLTDYIDEPFFHMNRPLDWVHEQLKKYALAYPDNADFVLNHMWGQYQTLNKYSANMFLSDVMKTGFCIEQMQTILRLDYLELLPADVSVADVMAAGTYLLLRPAK